MLQQWIKNVEQSGMELWTLERSGDLYLFLTQRKHEPSQDNGWNESCSCKMYHVWNKNKWVYVGEQYGEAIAVFDRQTKIR